MKRKSRVNESPESKIIPNQDLDTKQLAISGEKISGPILGVCDYCMWCYTAINARGVIEKCALCGAKTSAIPMSIEETSGIEIGSKGGMTLRFSRKLPMR